jgi:hypothetical protein
MNWKVVHYLLAKAYTATSYTGKGSLMYGSGFFVMLAAWFVCLFALGIVFRIGLDGNYKWGFHGNWTVGHDEEDDETDDKGPKLSKAERAQAAKEGMMKEIEAMLEPTYTDEDMFRHNAGGSGLKLLWPHDSFLRHFTFFTETFNVKVVTGLTIISIILIAAVLLIDTLYESNVCRIVGKLAKPSPPPPSCSDCFLL